MPTTDNQLYIGVKEITNIIPNNVTEISILPPISNFIFPNPMYADFYVVILYDNEDMPLTTCNLYGNQNTSAHIMSYNLNNLNSINSSAAVGLIFNGSNIFAQGIFIEDAYDVLINGNYSGFIGGTDPIGLTEGAVIGSFYYQNNELFGLSDDVPDTMFNGTDAIADISPYLTSNTSIAVLLDFQSSNSDWALSNNIWQLFLTYTTTCEEFEASVPEDVEICQGDSILLQVTGGNAYDWQPQIGLSCYDCPNPTYNDTITRWYTVRINNNDTCSKTLPVHVKVNRVPNIPLLSSEVTLCASNTGIIEIEPVDDTYRLVYGAEGINYTNLPIYLQLLLISRIIKFTTNCPLIYIFCYPSCLFHRPCFFLRWI